MFSFARRILPVSIAAVTTKCTLNTNFCEGKTIYKDRCDRVGASLLTETNVFGLFVSFKINPSFTKLNDIEKQELIQNVLAAVVEDDEVIFDTYLTRGLSGRSDFFLRLHSKDMAKIQALLLKLYKSELGNHVTTIDQFVGVSKVLNYISKENEPVLNASLSATPYSAPTPKYAIVVPVKKNADWWLLPKEERLVLSKQHTEKTLPWLINVKRKLYHSTGLDDVDFVTYFECEDLISFHRLMLELAQVEENKYHVRWGSPTIISTIEKDGIGAILMKL